MGALLPSRPRGVAAALLPARVPYEGVATGEAEEVGAVAPVPVLATAGASVGGVAFRPPLLHVDKPPGPVLAVGASVVPEVVEPVVAAT